MNLEKLENILSDEPKFRLKQAKRAVFVDLIDDWSQATVLPAALREKLNQACPLRIKAEVLKGRPADVSKALIHLDDGLKIESVLMRHAGGRSTVCLSSQVGCALGCLFCATGRMGFKRNLTPEEIVGQVLLWARRLKKEKQKVSNLVFMGMGEPFLNYENVMGAIRIFNSQDGFNIGARHISLSTVGVKDGIKKIAAEPLQLNLALSLHAPNDAVRAKLIPYDNAYPIGNLLQDANYYLAQTKRRLMIEYLLIDGLNDSPEQALELAGLLKQINPPLFFVNLIAYNPTADFQPPSTRKIFEFKKILRDQKIDVTERYRFGQDIKAACGQLAGR
ncbi:MAG: 23S rRNA (adenine(2503)-C(2))-methyltransferase RlmN [Patescibacteria group bacterium]|nr:23S rRNA (adenine(2503)-C(2))-methyltransferase RlmN [Patescibacteria group bacterium]